MFKKILIANRGEIAVRIIRACQELGIHTVAVYSQADTNALHTRLADEAVFIGEASPSESYLHIAKLINAAIQTESEAIHPGYGFLSESPQFAQAVSEAGLVFIGPSADAIQKMGIKTEARAIMEAAGVPIVPGFQSASAKPEDFVHEANKISYPIMVKAAGGGGGKGIRIVNEPSQLIEAIAAAKREALNAFNDESIFIEKYIARGRHIEVQVIADTHGNIVHLFERECSIQRRHQKIVEESPSPFITDEIRQKMGQAAIEAARAVNYVNAGTVEFIVDDEMNFYFLEMNTRLQVEHPITELVTGFDLVQLQLRIAAGEALWFGQDAVQQRGHAIECRIYAEDPKNHFLPAIGPVLFTEAPSGPGIRVDAGITTGDTVTMFYDPMIAKLIVYAENRANAIRRMDWALSHYVILGLTTNLQFLRDVIQHPVFGSAEATTHFIDTFFNDWQGGDDSPSDLALIAAAIAEFETMRVPITSGQAKSEGDTFSPWQRADQFRMSR